jgi:NAD(P)-dependent dehydrogenase (short-subunit alcohol dehydrogenase family)
MHPGADFKSKCENLVVSLISISTSNGLELKEDFLPKAALGLPIARIGDTEDIAALASYLASDSSGFITGKKAQLLFCHHTYS